MPQRRPEVVGDRVRERLQFFVDGRKLIAPLAELCDELLLPFAHDGVIDLHRCFAAADARVTQGHRIRTAPLREDDEEQPSRGDFAWNRNDIDAARRSSWKHPLELFDQHRAIVPPGLQQTPFRYRAPGLEISPATHLHDKLLLVGVPQRGGSALRANSRTSQKCTDGSAGPLATGSLPRRRALQEIRRAPPIARSA